MITVQGMTLDGATGAIYVAVGRAGLTQAYQIWQTPNPDALDVNDVRWELVHDLGSNTNITLLASGWSPDGLALYANICPARICEEGICEPASIPVLHRSLDGGQTWNPLPIPSKTLEE